MQAVTRRPQTHYEGYQLAWTTAPTYRQRCINLGIYRRSQHHHRTSHSVASATIFRLTACPCPVIAKFA